MKEIHCATQLSIDEKRKTGFSIFRPTFELLMILETALKERENGQITHFHTQRLLDAFNVISQKGEK